MALGTQRYFGTFWKLGAALACVNDLCGCDHRHGKAQRVHQRKDLDDRVGHCVVLYHRVYFWKPFHSRWIKSLGIHKLFVHPERQYSRGSAGRSAWLAFDRRNRGSGGEDHHCAAPFCGSYDSYRHHAYRTVPHHQKACRCGVRRIAKRPATQGRGAPYPGAGLGHRCSIGTSASSPSGAGGFYSCFLSTAS